MPTKDLKPDSIETKSQSQIRCVSYPGTRTWAIVCRRAQICNLYFRDERLAPTSTDSLQLLIWWLRPAIRIHASRWTSWYPTALWPSTPLAWFGSFPPLSSLRWAPALPWPFRPMVSPQVFVSLPQPGSPPCPAPPQSDGFLYPPRLLPPSVPPWSCTLPTLPWTLSLDPPPMNFVSVICYLLSVYVQIHCTWNRVGEKYLDDLLLPPWFWSVHSMDTLLFHEERICEWRRSDTADAVGHVTVTTWRM